MMELGITIFWDWILRIAGIVMLIQLGLVIVILDANHYLHKHKEDNI